MSSDPYWERLHQKNFEDGRLLGDRVSGHAIEAERLISSGSVVLDVGCGTGFDAVHFAEGGHKVYALDLSGSAINYCQKTHSTSISFARHDLTDPLNFEDSFFDLVYARLSLHYFSNSITEMILQRLLEF